MATFDVPDPLQETALSRIAQLLRPAGCELAALERGEHRLVSWERLVAEGCTLEQLLACAPACVLAWARTAEGRVPSLRMVCSLPTQHASPGHAVLAAWGGAIDAGTAALLSVDAAALDDVGLGAADVHALAWPDSRWRELLGATPRAIFCDEGPEEEDVPQPRSEAARRTLLLSWALAPAAPQPARVLDAHQLSRLQL